MVIIHCLQRGHDRLMYSTYGNKHGNTARPISSTTTWYNIWNQRKHDECIFSNHTINTFNTWSIHSHNQKAGWRIQDRFSPQRCCHISCEMVSIHLTFGTKYIQHIDRLRWMHQHLACNCKAINNFIHAANHDHQNAASESSRSSTI